MLLWKFIKICCKERCFKNVIIAQFLGYVSYMNNFCLFFWRHPDIKRTICKKCGVSLQIGSTAELTLPETLPEMYNFKCLKCGFMKRYKNNPNYKLWMENPESIVEVYDFSAKKDFNVQKKLKLEEIVMLTKKDRRAMKHKTEIEEIIVDADCMMKLDASKRSKLNELMDVDVLETKVNLNNVEIS